MGFGEVLMGLQAANQIKGLMTSPDQPTAVAPVPGPGGAPAGANNPQAQLLQSLVAQQQDQQQQLAMQALQQIMNQLSASVDVGEPKMEEPPVGATIGPAQALTPLMQLMRGGG